jgi:uncharacterized protein (DUF608 family)
MHEFFYTDDKQKTISFPLGGIGSGCIGLAGNGHLKDWEIFNRPNKGQYNGFSHFAVKVEDGDEVIDARILNGDLPPDYVGQLGLKGFYEGFGWGPVRETMAGMPHFPKNTFKGTFPVATLEFLDDSFPGKIEMDAFNPLIPHEDDDSSIPAAFFEFTITNTEARALDYYLTGVLGNPYDGRSRNRFIQKDGVSLMVLDSLDRDESDIKSGDVTLATDSEDVSYQEYLFRGEWFDNLEIYWKNTLEPGCFKNRSYEPADRTLRDSALISSKVRLEPGEKKTVRYVISWNHPNNKNSWGRMRTGKTAPFSDEEKSWLAKSWKNYYAILWKDSQASSSYSLKHWDVLKNKTYAFRDALFSSTLPVEVIDAVSANISTLKSPTVWRLEDGTLYGWEGVGEEEGSCEGSCTHVWGYAQALPFLFPKLSRSMRDAEFAYNWGEDGSLAFRTMLPLGSPRWPFRPAADGQFVTIMKVYREWRISGDDQWLGKLWQKVKKSMEFAWNPENKDLWDPKKTGTLTGRQHHTLDMEIFGQNSWLTGMYLGALKACVEMAGAMGEMDSAREYEEIYSRGTRFLNTELFNGEYFCQKIDIKDKSILKPFDSADQLTLAKDAESIYDVYWNDESQELKYQIGEGAALDQMLGQWHADIYGLGEIFEGNKTIKALNALMKYNFIDTVRNHYNPCRIYSLNDESGIRICSWPEGRSRPSIPLPYSQETMHGFEYAVADLMIRRGLLDDGLKIVKSIRDRYDGLKRNPWNEMECGSNYARSMASYALLLSFSGFTYDARESYMGFDPLSDGPFSFFWSFGTAWGRYTFDGKKSELTIQSGVLTLKTLGLNTDNPIYSIMIEGKEVEYIQKNKVITFSDSLVLKQGEVLEIVY